MKPIQTFGLLTLGLTLTVTSGWSQSAPTGTATSTTYPQGAITPDPTPSDNSRNNRQSGRRNRASRRAEQNNARTGSGTGTNTSPQDAQYRQSSSSNGTSVNSSNTTNYNSNNAVNAPTGAGSNPNSTGAATPPSNNDGTSNSMSSSSGSSSTGRSTSGTSDVSPTAAAVTGARTSPEPAVKAGSTERNTSIHDFVASSPNHVTLQNALQSAGLYDMLKGDGTYTLFAPTNAAFKKLPANVQAGLLEGQNRDALKQLLSYHLVQGNIDAAELTRRIKVGNGKAMLETAAGGTLTAQAGAGGQITLTDGQGKSVAVEAADQYQSNGVIHSISSVLMPKAGSVTFR